MRTLTNIHKHAFAATSCGLIWQVVTSHAAPLAFAGAYKQRNVSNAIHKRMSTNTGKMDPSTRTDGSGEATALVLKEVQDAGSKVEKPCHKQPPTLLNGPDRSVNPGLTKKMRHRTGIERASLTKLSAHGFAMPTTAPEQARKSNAMSFAPRQHEGSSSVVWPSLKLAMGKSGSEQIAQAAPRKMAPEC